MRTLLQLSTVPMAGMVACVFAASAVAVEDGLEPMAGTGGVMRDAERRALKPVVAPKEAKKLPEAKDAAKSDPNLDAVKGRVIGPIAAVKVFGSTEFADREGVSAKVLEALGGEGDKTIGDVLEAMEKVRQDLVKRGYYLVTIQLAKKGTYDKEQKTLSVLVDVLRQIS